MFKVAYGHTEVIESKDAALDLLKQCKESLGDLIPQGGFLFASEGYDFAELMAYIREQYPDVKLAGCSSFGEISSKMGIGESSAALMLFAADKPCIYSGLIKELSNNEKQKSFETIKLVLEKTQAKPVLCCLFADGLTSNISSVVRGLNEYLGNHALIAGGGACDDWKFQKVYQFCDNEVASNAASMLIFTDPLKSSVAVRHGRTPLPLIEKHIVTKSENNTVYTIDNKPALDFYRATLGEYATYEAYSLLIYLDDPEKFPDKYVIRAPFKINKEDGSITFPGDVPEGCLVGISQLSTQEKTLAAAKECAQKAMETYPGKKVEAALIFSCALRKEILGTQTYKELDLIKEQLPEGVPLFGYYTFGEVGPYNTGDQIDYYNETIVIALIGQ